MGCARIATVKDIQQMREARKGMQLAGSVMASGHIGLGLQMIRNSADKYTKTVGDIGERVTQNSLRKENAHNLNQTVKANLKIFDIGSWQRVASVKTHGVGRGIISRSDVGNYVSDLRIAVGCSNQLKDQKKFESAAQELQQAAAKAPSDFPEGLRQAADGREASEWLRENAELRIPDDHVRQVRSAINRSVIRNPSAYGLEAGASYGQRADLGQKLALRIQPMGITASSIEQTLDELL